MIRCSLLALTLALVSNGITHAPAADWPGNTWETITPAAAGLDAGKLEQARDYALTGEGSGCIIRGGKLVMAWGDQSALYDLKSSSKAIGVTTLGLALKDGKVRLDDPAVKFHPDFGVPPESNSKTGWLDKITLRQLANQTAGFGKPGGYTNLLFAPGTKWHYSDGGPNWLAECLTLVYGRDLNEVLFERVFTPIGIKSSDLRWRKNAYRPATINGVARREFGSGFSANTPTMARIGLLYLREGWWKGEQILTRDFIETIRRPGPELKDVPVFNDPNHGVAPRHYGLLWWNNADGALSSVPKDAYWSWGLFDSFIVVIPSLDIVVARAGKSWARSKNGGHYDPVKPFLEPIAAAAQSVGKTSVALYPPSPVITGVTWAPAGSIIRRAKGSDNWPLTWADDDALYTAYGDGNGFEPFIPEKLSIGIARVTGPPQDYTGYNVRAPSIEEKGDGKRGRKASGILMVDGVLYLLERNAGNAQLAWSGDHGATWTRADWKLSTSFGCPTFLNFGRNYADARDEFVYVYSQDSDNAYERADRMVLARVHRTKLRDRSAWEFIVKTDASGGPVWTSKIEDRGAVFSNPGACYRSGITYNAVLKRYLWCQIGAGADTRFEGGLAIYDAPEPWGPWTTVFHTDKWDVGPGESCSLPTKWISTNGKTLHLVFSGNDHFSVRQVTFSTTR